MPDIVSATAKMFADDTKLYRTISSEDDCKLLQQDLNALASWSQTWLLQFNASKCVVLKIRQSLNYIYTLNGIPLELVHEQKDLGITISDNLSPSTHIQNIVKKANQRIGLISRCFSQLDACMVKTLYTTVIRPVLE